MIEDEVKLAYKLILRIVNGRWIHEAYCDYELVINWRD